MTMERGQAACMALYKKRLSSLICPDAPFYYQVKTACFTLPVDLLLHCLF